MTIKVFEPKFNSSNTFLTYGEVIATSNGLYGKNTMNSKIEIKNIQYSKDDISTIISTPGGSVTLKPGVMYNISYSSDYGTVITELNTPRIEDEVSYVEGENCIF